MRPGLSVLDFGAGTGSSNPWVRKHLPGAHLTCLDPSRHSLEVAERRFPGQARFMYFDGRRIPMADGSFDVVYAMCVFRYIDRIHHVPPMSELRRVLKLGAQLFIFEFNPWNPPTRRVVNDCRFDENAVLIRADELEDEPCAQHLPHGNARGPRVRHRRRLAPGGRGGRRAGAAVHGFVRRHGAATDRRDGTLERLRRTLELENKPFGSLYARVSVRWRSVEAP